MTDTSAAQNSPKRNEGRLRLARFLTFILPLIVLFGAVGLVVAMNAARDEPEQSEEGSEPPAVLVAQAVSESVFLSVASQGEVRPRTEIDVVPQVGGRVVRVSPEFIEGGFFLEGDTLVEIENTDYRLAVTSAQASVAQAQRAMERELAESDIAARDWAELGDGEASGLVLREPQLAEARAALSGARASLANAQLDLERTVITAPFDGRVAVKSTGLGQFVSPGQSLGQIFDTATVEVNLPLADAELARAGLPVAFRESEGDPGPHVALSAIVGGETRTWEGRITRTASRFDATTRLLSAIAEVEDPYGAGADSDTPLAVGLFVSARIDGRHIENAIVLPRTALRGERELYVIGDDNMLEVRAVNVVDSDRTRIVLLEGVELGERVATSPLRGVVDGMEVSPLDPASADAGDSELAQAEPF